MKYYFINESLDKKIVGKYPQVEEAIYHCDVWDELTFIDQASFKQLDFEPIIANAILAKKAIPTDLISAGIVGFHLKKLMSQKLKVILQDSRSTGVQFHKAPIIYKNIELKDYWVINPFEFDYEMLDFSETEVFLMQHTFTKVEKLTVKDYKDFIKEKQEVDKRGYPYTIFIENVHFLSTAEGDLLFLQDVEGGTKYIASDSLKQRIEFEECIGIEFQPCELSLNEWLNPNGEREKIYGKI